MKTFKDIFLRVSIQEAKMDSWKDIERLYGKLTPNKYFSSGEYIDDDILDDLESAVGEKNGELLKQIASDLENSVKAISLTHPRTKHNTVLKELKQYTLALVKAIKKLK